MVGKMNWLQTLLAALYLIEWIRGAAGSGLFLGYLGASNDTVTTSDILRLLNDDISDIELTKELSVVSRMTNKCDVGEAIHHLFDLLNSIENEILALVVFSCTEVLKVIGEFAPSINLTVLGLGSSSAVLKSTEKYPTLQLLSEVENTHSGMRLSFVEHMGWDRVATVAEDYEDFTLAAEHFYKVAVNMNSSVMVNQSMTLVDSSADINNKISMLSGGDLRIIFMFGTQRFLEEILCSMSSTDFFKTRRVIITNQDISRVPLDLKELFYIGYASTQGVRSSSRDEHSSIIHSLLVQLKSFLSKQTSSLSSVQEIRAAFNKKFTYHGNYTTSLYKYSSHNGVKPVFNLLATSNDKEIWMKVTEESLWPDGRTPLDQKQRVDVYNEISPAVLYVFCTLSVLASLVAVVFLVINCKYKHVGPIKMSSPKLNYFNIIGAICLYGYVSVMGLSHPRLSKAAYQWTCTIRNLLLCGGYSFVFGPMCAKAYRVYYIFSSTRHGKISRKKLKDRNLLLFTGALVLFDIAFIVSWHLIDPFRIQDTIQLAPEQSELDKEVYLHSYTCSSLYLPKWMGVVYAYKGMLLIWGVYLAWTTRNVSIPTLNDSKSIIVNIYVVLSASVIVVIVSEFLQHDATLSYSIVGCLILVSTTIMLGVLFIPQIVSLWKISECHTNSSSSQVEMHAIPAIGLVQSSNTKRLETDSSEEIRELELQSTVLQSEIHKLDEEIVRLETMARLPNIQISDFLAEGLLYILPLPNSSEDTSSCKLTRKNTPKYRIKRKKQEEWISAELKRRQNSEASLRPSVTSISYIVTVPECEEVVDSEEAITDCTVTEDD